MHAHCVEIWGFPENFGKVFRKCKLRLAKAIMTVSQLKVSPCLFLKDVGKLMVLHSSRQVATIKISNLEIVSLEVLNNFKLNVNKIKDSIAHSLLQLFSNVILQT